MNSFAPSATSPQAKTPGMAVLGVPGRSIGLICTRIVSDDELKRRVVPPVLAGEKIAALAITEPGGGSDVAALRTTAVRDGDHFVVDGEKTFITSGVRDESYTIEFLMPP